MWAGVVAGTTYAPQGPAFKPTFPTTPSRSCSRGLTYDTCSTRRLKRDDKGDDGVSLTATMHPSQSQPVFRNPCPSDAESETEHRSRTSNNKCETQLITETVLPNSDAATNGDATTQVSFSVDSSDDSDSDKKLESDDGVVLTSQSSVDVTPANLNGHLEVTCSTCGTLVTVDPRRLRSQALTLSRHVKKPGHHVRKMGYRGIKGKRVNDLRLRHATYQRSKSDEIPSNRIVMETQRKSMTVSGGQQPKYGDNVTARTGGKLPIQINGASDANNVTTQQNYDRGERRLRNSSGNGSGRMGEEGEGVSSLAVPKRRRRRRRQMNRHGSGTGQGHGQSERTTLENSHNSVSVHGGNPKWSWK